MTIYPDAHAVRTNDGVEEYWEVRSGDYDDEPDLVIAVLHATDSDGKDQSETVAKATAAALATRVIPMPTTPYTGLLEDDPGSRLAAVAALHRGIRDNDSTHFMCPECAKAWPCPTADAVSRGIYLAATEEQA